MWVRFWLRILGRAALVLLVGALAAYPVDWGVWRVRVARGGGMGQVEVTELVAAQLKGNKEEYYENGAATVACSRSLYPQGGNSPCWWLERHRDEITRY